MAKRKNKAEVAAIAPVADDSATLASMVAERDAAIRALAFPPAMLLLTDQRIPEAPASIAAPWLATVDVDVPVDVPVEPTAARYVLQIDDSFDSQVTAAVLAEGYAKALRARVCVVDADTGERVRCYDPPVRRARGESEEKVETRQRGADWSSKSGQAVRAMQAPGGASMDEMRAITGWTFGQKYVDQLARSFGVVITTVPATARLKRMWCATKEASADAESNVIDLAAAMLAAD